MLPDERIICTNSIYERIDAFHGKNKAELLVLTKVPYSEAEHKTIITLASLFPNEIIKESVISFNKSNPAYRIHIIDYYTDSGFDFDIALTRMTKALFGLTLISPVRHIPIHRQIFLHLHTP